MQIPDLPQTTLPLRDIKLPAEPGFWPLAPGWWALLVIVVLLLSWLAVRAHQHRQRKKHWLAIEQQLSAIEHEFSVQHDKQLLLQQLSGLLRRFVRHHLRDEQALSTSGDDWIAYLNQWLPDQPFTPFSEALTAGVYQPACDYDEQQLLMLIRRLIKTQVMRATPKPVKGGQHV